MKNRRQKIYVHGNAAQNKIIYTGINFCDFVTGVKPSLENLILLKGDYLEGSWCDNYNFVYIEGNKNIKDFLNEDIYKYGDFHFIDYQSHGGPNNLSPQQVAKLLYLSHMQQPLDSPFFDNLSNRFVYLAHDDGFYCKLFCHNVLDFIDVLIYKILRGTGLPLHNVRNAEFDNVLWSLIEQGIFLDLTEIQLFNYGLELPVYLVGKIDNMDTIYNLSDELKKEVKKIVNLRYINGTWDFGI